VARAMKIARRVLMVRAGDGMFGGSCFRLADWLF
jgi:hypothetical protein